jgi:hypothetical protein
MYAGGQLVQNTVDGSRAGYSGDFTQIEKGIYQNKKGRYKIKGQRAKKYIDKTFPEGTKLTHVKKALNQWYGKNPIKVEWKEGQKIKLISEGKAGEQVHTDIVYKSKKIENDFINALKDFGGENKGNWTTSKLTEKFGSIYQDASIFVRKQDPTLVRDTNKVYSLKYADELEAAGFEDWDAAKKANKQSAIKASYQRKIDPYVKKGFDVSRKQLAKNIGALNKFEKSGQTLEDFYEIFKDRQFKKNLRAYMRGEAGPMVTDVWDEAGFKSKYKSIIPKMKKHLEVWHEQSDPVGKTKAQIKKAKVVEFSKLEVENLIKKAKRVVKTDYDNILDLAHRQDLIIDQNISELGIERPEINRVLIKDAELERNKLHKKNYALVEEIKKGKNVQKNLNLIAGNNHRIKQIAQLTKGRLSGIIMDTETLSPVKLKPSNIMGVDAGIFNKPIKEMTEANKLYLKNTLLPTVIEEARSMTPEKIASELSGIMDDEVLSKKLATRMEKLKTGRQITQTVFDKSKQVYNLMEKNLEKAFKERGIKISNAQKGAISMDLLKDIGKLGPKGLKLLSSEWVWPEIVIGWLDKQNMIQKGMSPERASSEMWKHVTFGLRDKGGTENAILEQAKKLGYGEKDIKALEHMMRYGKIGKEIEKTEIGIESMEKGYTPFSSEKGAQQLKEKLENLKKERESVAGFYFGAIGDKDSNYGFEIYDQASKELMRTEWNKSLEGRKKQLDPYAGKIGNWLNKEIFTLNAPERAALQKQIDAMSPQELELFNMERGIGEEKVHPLYGAAMSGKQMEPLRDQIGYMYAGGGRAGYTNGGLTRTVARDSRPMEQGLRSLYINDKDY